MLLKKEARQWFPCPLGVVENMEVLQWQWKYRKCNSWLDLEMLLSSSLKCTCTALYFLSLLSIIGQCQFTTSWPRYWEIFSFPFLSFPNDSLNMRRFVFLLSSLLIWLAVFHTVASIESKIFLQKSWPKTVQHHFWLLNRNFHTREASGLSVSVGLSQTTHNKISGVQQPEGKGWVVVHLSNGQREQDGKILCIAAPRMDLFQRLPGTGEDC